MLDEPGAAKLLSAVRIDVGRYGGASEGHSGATGMTWHTSNDLETFSVTARPVPDGTAVTVVLDRRGTLIVTGAFALCGSVLAGLAGMGLGSEFMPAVGVAASIAGIGAVLTLACGYWASSTRTARERIERAIDAASQSLNAIGAAGGTGENAATVETDVQLPADAS